jgi:hypothetical protein
MRLADFKVSRIKTKVLLAILPYVIVEVFKQFANQHVIEAVANSDYLNEALLSIAI